MLIERTFSLLKNNHLLLRAFYHFQSNSPPIPAFVQNGGPPTRPNHSGREGEAKGSFGAPCPSSWACLLCSLTVSGALRLFASPQAKATIRTTHDASCPYFIYFYRFVLIIFHHTSHDESLGLLLKEYCTWEMVKQQELFTDQIWQVRFICAIDKFLELCVRKNSEPASGFTRKKMFVIHQWCLLLAWNKDGDMFHTNIH